MESPRGLKEAHIHCANCRACLSLRQQSVQWAHGLVGHGDAPVLSEGCEPLISGQDVPLRYRVGCVDSRSKLPRERFSPLALFGRRTSGRRCRLLGLERTLRLRAPKSGNEPKAGMMGFAQATKRTGPSRGRARAGGYSGVLMLYAGAARYSLRRSAIQISFRAPWFVT